MIEVNGTAHVILTVSQWEKASTLHGTHLFFFPRLRPISI